jgi:hypothetical protein
MIMLTAISPIAILFFGPFLLLYILIPNLYIYSKYYKRHGESTFELHISEMLKKCVISMTIVIISFLPLLSMLFINYAKIENGTGYLVLIFSMTSIFIGFLGGWIYYLYSLIKASGNVDSRLFNNAI